MEPKLYTLQMWGCVEPNLFGPFPTEEERVAATKAMNDSAEHSYCRIDIDENGIPTVSSFVSGEIDHDSDESEEGGEG